MTPTGSIYTLSDPRDGSIRYVGKTMQSLHERLAGHLSAPTNPAMRLWISTLAAQGLTPEIQLIATAPAGKLSAKEARLIYRHARDGHRLLNAPYYRQHMSDLTYQDTPAESVAAPPEPFHEYRRALYGPIAFARIAGRFTKKRAAWEVARRTPTLVGWVLWQVPATRYIARAALVAGYLWMIGFDRLFRSEVLPLLPVDEAAAFGAEYLATPALTLGLHLSIACLGWSALTYREVREDIAREVAQLRKPVSPLDADLVASAAAALDHALTH